MAPVRCRFCDHDNPDAARFCNACGSPVHLKPCPQCEAVNDLDASQCYECGAALDGQAAPSDVAASTESTVTETAKAGGEPQHIPESVGARLADLPPIEGNANVAAAERRDAFVRSSRMSRAFFFAVVLIVFAALGYYGYEHAGVLRGDATTASAEGQPIHAAPATERFAQSAAPENAEPPATASGDSKTAPLMPRTKSAEPKPVVAEAVAQPAVGEEPSPVASKAATANESKQPFNASAVAKTRQASARPAAKPETDPYSRPAAASNASAAATQQTIERYLGIRAGVTPQRSPY